ncbi:peptidase domain-containing ABC transporter [Cellvibrio mixtus]|uniref:peptidase domain-containing ABC transporter n=1 Tax=Cellvibrio mixtus TaxID=39650 RepID=UPI000A0614C3|nr:peptidase domain-containing ABC transporter [Cellvibrio mixtus]
MTSATSPQTNAAPPSRAEELLRFGRGPQLPVILQNELAECGLACLAMISCYYGYQCDLSSLRRRFSISAQGINLKQLLDMANRLHLAGRALRGDIDDLEQLQLPCILHWGMNHFVVLKEINRRGFLIHDPAQGERLISRDEIGKFFTGVALELNPTTEFKKAETRERLTLGHFWSRLVGLKRNLAHIVFLSLLLQIFMLITPFYLQTVVDDVILRHDQYLLLVLALGFGLLLLIQQGTNVLRDWVVLHLSMRLGMQMSANLFRHLIRLPMDYFSKRHMGDIVSRFGSLDNLRQLLTTGLVTALVDGVMASLTLIVLFIYSATLTWVVIGIVLCYALLRWFLYRPLHLLTEESIAARAKENSHFMESVRAIQTIKIFHRESDRQHYWQNYLAEAMNKDIRIARWNLGYQTAKGILFGIENILVIYLAADAVMGNIFSIGMLYAFISYKDRFVRAMDNLITQGIEFKMLGLHLNRLADIAFTPTDPVADNNTATITDHSTSETPIAGHIRVQNLSFRYGESEAPVFSGVNFEIQAGETVAIVGPSGCGKSTLIKCLMGLFTPTGGEIFIDGKPMQKLPQYRRQIAAVMQDDQLMSGDIAENIACFEQPIDLARVYHCAQLACIHEDILSMPMQYNTLVGDMGASLSGGQKQRVLLARALYRAPRILFMDEATSHLDTINEQQVNQHIRELMMTRVIVAHRPETVASAGRTIYLETPNNIHF